MTLYWHFLFAFVATAAFGVLFQAPRHTLALCGIVGAVGWCAYKYLLFYEDYSSFYANFVATVALSIVAESFARLAKEPSTIFIATGVIPLVPGLGMYKGMEKIIAGSYEVGMNILLTAGTDSMAIALGVMLVASIFHFLRLRALRELHANIPKINKNDIFGS